MKPHSVLKWDVRGTSFELVETQSHLIVGCVIGDEQKELARLERGEIRAVIELHAARGCELRVITGDEDEPLSIYCPHSVCTVLLVKLRKFQGGNLEVIATDSSSDPAVAEAPPSRV